MEGKKLSVHNVVCCYERKTIYEAVSEKSQSDITLNLEKGADISEFYEKIKNELKLKYGGPTSTNLADAFEDKLATINLFNYDPCAKDSGSISIVLSKKAKEKNKSEILTSYINGVNEIIITCAEYCGIELVCGEVEIKSVHEERSAFKTPKLFFS
ncbi:hypothetical protein HYU07_01170 [Candidatus Woesearchaeota archaeon]|nr:hypothetical protein [Candidatus Woesearchaeota archaeon]